MMASENIQFLSLNIIQVFDIIAPPYILEKG